MPQRFLQINDLHLQGDRPITPRRAASQRRASWLLETIRVGGPATSVDFVLGLGDQVEGGSLEETQADLDAFAGHAAQWECPFYPVPGNHDIGAHEGEPQWEQPFLSAFDLTATNYSFVRDGLRFLMLNNAGTLACSAVVARRRADWLASQLTTGEKLPTVLCCHVPLLPMRDPEVLAASCRFQPWQCAEPAVLEAVRAHRDQVVAVLSGHLHLTGVVEDCGVTHVCVAGVATFPSDYAVYTHDDGRLAVEIRQVPPSLLDPASNIHGPPRHDRDFVDRGHTSPVEYVMGRDDERRFCIDLGRR
ncbi:MAG: metallophosphoesterase [Pirellulales bacterium]